MPTRGQVFDLQISALVGPWQGGRHPGLIVSRLLEGAEPTWVVVPLTSSRSFRQRSTHVEIAEPYGDLMPTMWIQCEYPTTVPNRIFQGLTARAALPEEIMRNVQHALGWLLKIAPE